ncbi:hypothetical protein HMPREF9123_1804 [Neisseria bacilliformis ATCC BAA-1200]|uniref:Uncharacterized protein n=1 Tax=Neisseria bacilliformis ATCC BAA-1200 TaxID=888742 RepID=F2BDJ8_9NEIS|nr:hypothetical protein HMPREF9123_1804 [Neisseria bacilliformis ATCC BAA-1200]
MYPNLPAACTACRTCGGGRRRKGRLKTQRRCFSDGLSGSFGLCVQ